MLKNKMFFCMLMLLVLSGGFYKTTASENLEERHDAISVKINFNLAEMWQQAGNQEKALGFYLLAAEGGDTEARYRVAEYYKKANNVDQATLHYTLAANNGHAQAQYMLGYRKYKVTNEIEEGLKYLFMAADQGHQRGQFMIGEHYKNTNIDTALVYYILAADQGHENALFIVNDSKSVYLKKKYGEIPFNVGQFYNHKNDAEQALHYYVLAAAQEHPEA